MVLLAADIEVPTERFAGKKIYRCGTGIALKQSEATLKALSEGQQIGCHGGLERSNRRRQVCIKHC